MSLSSLCKCGLEVRFLPRCQVSLPRAVPAPAFVGQSPFCWLLCTLPVPAERRLEQRTPQDAIFVPMSFSEHVLVQLTLTL